MGQVLILMEVITAVTISATTSWGDSAALPVSMTIAMMITSFSACTLGLRARRRERERMNGAA
jgi:hypothetical protein